MTSNRLQNELSPYLLQHAHNPVDWYPWGEEAFARATEDGRLIFLSIGYATCHWCHVMERESFEDEEVAAALARDFVALKVDREERPDIDQFYMQVATRLTGQGGWPLTIVMTPDKLPLFAATYLPKRGGMGRPGLLELLPRIAAAWADHPEELRRDAGEFLQRMAPAAARRSFSPDLIARATQQMKTDYDAEKGGFGAAPKFPRPHQLAFLLQRYRLEGDESLLRMVEGTLAAMRDGGIYDQIGFGFHRYSTDRSWLLPHFEKMLYDQAGLAEVYLKAFQLTGKSEYAATAREIFHYLRSNMRHPDGGFFSAEDADTKGVEGSTYLWQKAEVVQILGPERGERFARCFNLKESGNFQPEVAGETGSANIPHRRHHLTHWAEEFGVAPQALASELEASRRALLQARNCRPQPFCDDKILTAWNAMAISALSRGALALDEPELQRTAVATLEFILRELTDDQGQLLRRWRNGQAAINAFAEDYAWLSRALLDLYSLELNPVRLEQALHFAGILFDKFAGDGTIYIGADLRELPQRTTDRYDGATPSTPSVALEVAARLFALTGEPLWRDRAQELLEGATPEVQSYPQGFPHLLQAAERLCGKSRDLVILGRKEDAPTAALLAPAQRGFQPLTTLLFVDEGERERMGRLAPFTRAMEMSAGRPTAYLCEEQTCGRPITDPAELARQLH